MATARTLQQKYKPHFELPENSVLRLHKAQYRNRHYSREVARLTHVSLKTQNQAYSGLENK